MFFHWFTCVLFPALLLIYVSTLLCFEFGVFSTRVKMKARLSKLCQLAGSPVYLCLWTNDSPMISSQFWLLFTLRCIKKKSLFIRIWIEINDPNISLVLFIYMYSHFINKNCKLLFISLHYCIRWQSALGKGLLNAFDSSYFIWSFKLPFFPFHLDTQFHILKVSNLTYEAVV